MKVNQRGEGSGCQSSPVVLRTIILMAVGLSLLFSGTAQAQLSFTNVQSGNWTVSGVWGVNVPDASSNDYTIVFTNTLPDLSSNNLANPFQLNQLIFAPPAQPVTLSRNGLQFSFSTSNGTLPQVLQNSTNDMTINVNIGLDTNITFAGTGSGGVTVNGAISGSYRLTKSGSYILTLTTNNSYSGGTVINNGAVAFTATNRAPQSGTITVNSSGSVWFQDGNVPPQLDKSSAGGLAVGTGAGSTNYDFSTSGLSNMALVAAQTLTNDYPLTPSGNEYRIGALSGTTFTYTNQLTGAYSLNIGPGGGTVVLTNFSNTFTGSTTIRDGTVLLIIADNNIGAGNTNLILSSGGTLWVAGSFTLTNRPVTVNSSGGGLNVDPTFTLTITNVISGPGVLTKSGTGDLSLKAINTVGGVTINAGRVILNSGIGLSNALVTINVDNGLTNASNDRVWVLGGLGGTNRLSLLNALNQTVTHLKLGSDNNLSGTYSGQLAVAGLRLIKIGSNTQILNGDNTFGSITTNSGGVLQFNNTNAMGGRTVKTTYGAATAAGYPIDQWFLDQVAANSSGVVAQAVDSTNALNFDTAILAPMSLGAVGSVINGGSISPRAPGGVGGNDINYRLGGGGGTLTLTNVNALVGNSSSLFVSGNGTPGGTVVLAANNTYGSAAGGSTVVANATLQINTDIAAGGGGTIYLNGGSLNLNTGASDGGPAYPLAIIGPSYLTVLGGNHGWTGVITGGAPFYVDLGNNRTLTFRGDMSQFSGTFAVVSTNGTIRFYGAGGSSNAVFDLGPGNVRLYQRGTAPAFLYFGAMASPSTGTVLQARCVDGGNTRLDMFRIGDVNTNTTFAGWLLNGYETTGDLDQMGILKVGNGVWTLTGNTLTTNIAFSGGMTISNGQVVVTPTALSTNYGAGSSAAAGGGASRNVWTVVPDNGLVFSNGAPNEVFTIGALAGPGDLSLTDAVNGAGITLRINSGPLLDTIYSGNLAGSGGKIIKEGPGVQTIAGTNTYTGGTYIYAGVLGFGSADAYPGGTVSVSDGASVGLFFTNIISVLTNLSRGTAGGIAISSNSAMENVDFAGAGITNAWFVAAQNLTYGGTFTPLTNVFRLGANAGTTFRYTNVINDVAGWAPTTLNIGAFGGGTVALFAPRVDVISSNSWNNCGTNVYYPVFTTNDFVIVTNRYTGGTTVWGTNTAWSTLYIASDSNLGAPTNLLGNPATLTLNSGALQATNSFTLNNRPIALGASSGIAVDQLSRLTVTNQISGTGPLVKYGAGTLVLGTNSAFTGGTVISNGAVAYGNANAAAGNSLTVNAGGAVGFLFPGVQASMAGLIANNQSSGGGVALFATNANENISFSPPPGADLWRMSLVAAEDVTYGGTYTPYNNPGGNFYRLGALTGATLTYTNSILDSNGASSLVIGGFSGGFGGTVFLTTTNAHNGGTAATAEGFGQTTIMSPATLYITNDAALGAPGLGGSDPAFLYFGGLLLSNATLRTTNDITLNNRLVQLRGNGTFNVDAGSTLTITNTIQLYFSTAPLLISRVALTKAGGGLLILTASNNIPVVSGTVLDTYINGGVVRAAQGVGINFFVINASGNDSNSTVYLDGGVWEVTSGGYLTNRVTNTQRTGGVSFHGTRSGLSAYDQPLIVWLGTDALATDTNSSSNVSTQRCGSGSFEMSTLVLNESTANTNLTWLNHIDLGSATNGVTTRTIDVSAANPLVTKIFGCIMNASTTNNTGFEVGALTKTGVGTLELETNNTYNGATTINQGTLKLQGLGSITNSMFIVVGVNSTSNAYFDVTGVTNSGPYKIGNDTNQTLAGFGSVIGDVTLTNRGSLAPGDTATRTNWYYGGCGTNTLTNTVPALVSGVGTLTFSNNLTVVSANTLIYDLGTNSDSVEVKGDLRVGGKLRVRDSGGLGLTNLYTLIHYAGALRNDGLDVDTNACPGGFNYALVYSPTNYVKLNVSGGLPCSPPTNVFTATPTLIPVGSSVTFTDLTTGTVSSNYTDFGDGGWTNNLLPPTNFSYTYFAPGTFLVTNIEWGCESACTSYVTVTVLSAYDWWRSNYWGNLTDQRGAPGADPDGDGISNTNEFLAGTNPTNSLSGLRITSVVRQAVTNIVITWNAVGGKSYVVQTNAPPASGNYTNNFSDLSSVGPIPGSGDTTAVYTNWAGATNAPSRYYRIRLGP